MRDTFTKDVRGGRIESQDALKVFPDEEDRGTLFLAAGDPDFVVVPDVLGGGRVDVVGRVEIDGCPNCDAEGPFPGYVLDRVDDGGRWGVVGCTACRQYVWVRPGSPP